MGGTLVGTPVSPPLAAKPNGSLQVAGFAFSATGAVATGKPTADDWRQAMAFAERANSGVMWWIGDLLRIGEAQYSDVASEYEGDGKFSYGTLRNVKSVSCRVNLSLRNDKLTWNHHAIVAELYVVGPNGKQTKASAKAQKVWLQCA